MYMCMYNGCPHVCWNVALAACGRSLDQARIKTSSFFLFSVTAFFFAAWAGPGDRTMDKELLALGLNVSHAGKGEYYPDNG